MLFTHELFRLVSAIELIIGEIRVLPSTCQPK